MGVLIGISVTQFRIKKANLEYILAVIRNLPPWMRVDYEIDWEHACLTDLFIAWRWQPEFDESGDLIGLRFLGEKVGNDEDIFEALAPYVEPGAIVKFSSEFGSTFLKFAADGIRRGSSEKLQYSVWNLRIPASNLATAPQRG